MILNYRWDRCLNTGLNRYAVYDKNGKGVQKVGELDEAVAAYCSAHGLLSNFTFATNRITHNRGTIVVNWR